MHSAAASASAVLEQQVATLHVALNAMRVERDNLAQALQEARQDAAGARAEAQALEGRWRDERRRAQALQQRLKESEAMRMEAERRAADADWTARDEFARPKSACSVSVLDVDLFEAQMERDLYRAQYEEEEEAREQAERERDELREELKAALEGNAQLMMEMEGEEEVVASMCELRVTEAEEENEQSSTAESYPASHALGVRPVEVPGEVEKKCKASSHSQVKNEDAKENEAPRIRIHPSTSYPSLTTNSTSNTGSGVSDAMSWTSLCGFRKAMLPSPWTSSTHSSASSVKAPAFRLIFRLTTLNLIVECFQASRLSKLSTSRTGISTGNLSSTPLPCDHGQWTLRFGCR